MTAKFALLVMVLLHVSMVPTSSQKGKIDEETRLKCGQRCLDGYEVNLEMTSAFPMYEQCLSDCNDNLASSR